jgi:tRNA threonylcarbamoyladenosine biosynthesis protein TsaE
MFIENFTEDQLPEVARKIITDNPHSRIIAFYGKMGVGKTTLIKAICSYLQVTDVVGSPTFSIVNQYMGKCKKSIFHFDFYRLSRLEEVFDLGYEDYFYSGNYCLIEWPEKIEPLLPDSCLRIYLQETNGIRKISYNINTVEN